MHPFTRLGPACLESVGKSFPREVFEPALTHSLPDKVEAACRRGDLIEKRKVLMQVGDIAQRLLWAMPSYIVSEPGDFVDVGDAINSTLTQLALIDSSGHMTKTPYRDQTMKYIDIFSTIVGSDAVADWTKSLSGSRNIHFFTEDVDLRIEYGFDEEDEHQKDFIEPWANKFSNPQANSYFVSVFYRSTLIERVILVYVDGSRVALPLPNIHTLTVHQLPYRVAQVVDGSRGNLDSYMAQAGLTVVP